MSNTKVRFQLFSDDELDNSSSDESIDKALKKKQDVSNSKYLELKDTLKLVNPSKYDLIPIDTKVCYQNNRDVYIFNKLFKGIDNEHITFAFLNLKSKSYKIPIEQVKKIFTYGFVGGAPKSDDSTNTNDKTDPQDDPNLKNTILLPKKEWDTIQSGTIISYKKSKSDDYTYKVKFNSIVETKKGKKYSLTNSAGFNYMIIPKNIEKIYRHIMPMDITMIKLLESIELLNTKVSKLEKIVNSLIKSKK